MRMNYRHAFHAGNHADVLKHVVLLAICDALTVKPTPLFALDTHAGRGLYALDSNSAQRTGEAEDGIGRLLAEAPRDPLLTRYLKAVRDCRSEHGRTAYPGSPWLLAHALRPDDRIRICDFEFLFRDEDDSPAAAVEATRDFLADPEERFRALVALGVAVAGLALLGCLMLIGDNPPGRGRPLASMAPVLRETAEGASVLALVLTVSAPTLHRRWR